MGNWNHNILKKAIAYSMISLMTLASVQPAAAFQAGPAAVSSEENSITIFEGTDRKVVKSHASDFKSFLKEQKISLGLHDKYWTSTEKPAEGSVVVIERAMPVTIVADGRSRTVYTTQQTVQGVVNDAGYDWHTRMPLEDGLSKVHSGMTIHVVSYNVRMVSRTEETPVVYEKWYDSTLPAGDQVIMREGTPGKKIVETEEFVSNGKVIKSNVVSSSVISNGTDGMARTGSSEGTVGYVRFMNATAYHPCDGDGAGITATGTVAGYGTVAVDPSVIPLGSHVYIPNYGDAVAADTGGAIVGDRIDLCFETYAECYNFGRQPVEVFVRY